MRFYAALAALSVIAAPAAAENWGLPQLMHSLAARPSATARFTERDTSPVLSAPLTSTGTLAYAAPDYLRKTTLTPARQDFILDHNRISLTANGATRVFTLDQDPRIAGLVQGIAGTLSGNLPALEATYRLTLTGTKTAWQLQLTPKDQNLARFLRAMTLTGNGSTITSIDTSSADGSESRLTITDAP